MPGVFLQLESDTNNTGMEAMRISYLYWLGYLAIMITMLIIAYFNIFFNN